MDFKIAYFTFFILTISQAFASNANANGADQFKDIFPLTLSNFTESVLENQDSWIVIFHDGFLLPEWKNQAFVSRGVVWFGMIDTREEEELLKLIKYDPDSKADSRVYPFGSRSIKESKWQEATSLNNAWKLAVDSIPDQLLKVKGRDLQDFIVESFSSVPSRFPLLVLTDEDSSASLFKALATRFSRYFNFGRMTWPTTEDYRLLGLKNEPKDFPCLLVLVPNEPKMITDVSFGAVMYDKDVMGRYFYPNLVHFLFTVNEKYRYFLLGENLSGVEDVVQMRDIMNIESKRFDIFIGGKLFQPRMVNQTKSKTPGKRKKSKTVAKQPLSDERVYPDMMSKDEL